MLILTDDRRAIGETICVLERPEYGSEYGGTLGKWCKTTAEALKIAETYATRQNIANVIIVFCKSNEVQMVRGNLEAFIPILDGDLGEGKWIRVKDYPMPLAAEIKPFDPKLHPYG